LPIDERTALPILLRQKPKLEVRQKIVPVPLVVVALVCASGEIFVNLTPRMAREVAATLIAYAAELERFSAGSGDEFRRIEDASPAETPSDESTMPAGGDTKAHEPRSPRDPAFPRGVRTPGHRPN